MKAYEIMKWLYGESPDKVSKDSCDNLKSGSPDTEVTGIAVTMFPTVKVIKQAAEFGAELMIVHEPVYYNHKDALSDDKQVMIKKKLIEDSGLTIYRYHDHPHYNHPDLIIKGELEKLDFDGNINYTDRIGVAEITLNTPASASEIAKRCEEKLGIKHVRISGEKDKKCSLVVFTPGSLGENVFKELQRDGDRIVICGETCEWAYCEYARDAAELGMAKSLIPLGHAVSERDGMEYTANILKKQFGQIKVKYFDCGDVFD